MAISDSFSPDNPASRGRAHPPRIQAVIATGAITIADGVVTLDLGSAIAATLDDPPAGMDGARLVVTALSAQAHTVTYTTGFSGGGSSSDVATYGGAIGDSMNLLASGGAWYVTNLLNVTLG